MSDFQSRVQSALGHEFLIERELGGGGMSRVFLATEKALQRHVVVKVLPPDLAAGVNVERFRREIHLAAQLQHPHIVPLLAAGDDNGLLWFSMPYIEGESLRGALSRGGRLPVRDVIRILHDVVDALAYAHARGVVHRDIKPDNVLASGMHALVTDFGVAKALSAAVPLAGGTTTGMAIGTPAYMAPEQLAADPAADHRVDLYAIGLLAYELLTGKSPFSGSSPQATLAAQLTKTPEPPHLSFTDVPEGLSAIIMHCLEKEPSRRPQSASALLAELDALPPVMSGATVAVRAHGTARRRRTSLVAGGLVAVAALAYAAIMIDDEDWRGTTAAAADSVPSTGARDAGPGGDRSRTMAVTPSGATRPETVIVVYRDPGATDGVQGTQVPLVISRAESLAIAEAMQKRREQTMPTPAAQRSAANAQAPAAGQGAGIPRAPGVTSTTGAAGVASAVEAGAAAAAAFTAPAGGAGMGATQGRVFVSRPDGNFEFSLNRQELLSEVRRVFTDSMSIALRRMDSALARLPRGTMVGVPLPEARPEARVRMVAPLVGPNADGRVRLVVTDFAVASRRGEMTNIGRELADFLRASLPADRYEVMEEGVTSQAQRLVRGDPMSLGWTLRSDYVVSGVVRERNDSLVVMTQFIDVRSGHNSTHAQYTMPMTDQRKAFETALARVSGWLEQAKSRSGVHGGPRAPGMPASGAKEKPPETIPQRGSERGL